MVNQNYCIINLKAYEEVFNTNLDKFISDIESCSDLAEELNVRLVLCINSYDLKDAVRISNRVDIYSQHIDPVDFGSRTGHFPTICSIRLGSVGTLISHSEHYLSLEETIERSNHAQELGLTTCICVRDNERLEQLRKNNVMGLVALEPPELIGGDVSVTSANPEIITQAYEAVKLSNLQLLVGAGIKSKQDVQKAMELGANGILVASGIVKSDSVKDSLIDLLEGFR